MSLSVGARFWGVGYIYLLVARCQVTVFVVMLCVQPVTKVVLPLFGLVRELEL